MADAKGETILELAGITKLYPGSIALYEAHMRVRRGEVHGIIGKNGAGKSTLVNIISGITAPTEGTIALGGKRYGSLTRQKAKREGIAIVTQEPEVVPDFTVAENLFFPDYPKTRDGRVHWKEMGREAAAVLQAAGLFMNAQARMSDLSLSEQQLVLVAKAFYREKAEIVILDEVTASLASRDGARLYEIIDTQKRAGKAVLFISHHMGEILEICDRVTVLRDGRIVAAEESKNLDTHLLSLYVVGDDRGESVERRPSSSLPSGAGAPPEADAALSPPASGGRETGDDGRKNGTMLAVRDLTRAGAFHGVSFTLKKGEILGIAGLRGSGRTEILKALAGIDRIDGGTILLGGSEGAFRSPAEASAKGVMYLPENRDREGLIEMQSVRVNLSLSSLRHFTRGLFINKREERTAVEGLIEALSIVTPSPDQEVRNLSGGNRQKVVVGKILASKPLVYLLDEPTRGIDISAKKSILAIIKERLARTSGVIMTSPGLEDLVSVCDRILILYKGTVVAEFARGEFTERELYLAIHGEARNRGS